MSKIILADPYSGALNGYFSEQIGGNYSHTKVADGHPYYRTLYGADYRKYVELTLNFLLLYDDVLIAPADNHWPVSKSNPNDQTHIVELGLHADWDDFHAVDYHDRRRYVTELLNDRTLQTVLEAKLRLPKKSWDQVVEYALYEASLSARTRTPILCSSGRRALISCLIQIQRPSLHPVFTPTREVDFVETYRSLSGLALAPRSLDQLMDTKPNPSVRKYGRAFISAVESLDSATLVTKRLVAKASLEAIHTREVAELFAGNLKWGSVFLRLINKPLLAAGASGMLYLASKGADDAGWYEFKGSIDHAISHAEFVHLLEDSVSNEDADA